MFLLWLKQKKMHANIFIAAKNIKIDHGRLRKMRLPSLLFEIKNFIKSPRFVNPIFGDQYFYGDIQ